MRGHALAADGAVLIRSVHLVIWHGCLVACWFGVSGLSLSRSILNLRIVALSKLSLRCDSVCLVLGLYSMVFGLRKSAAVSSGLFTGLRGVIIALRKFFFDLSMFAFG